MSSEIVYHLPWFILSSIQLILTIVSLYGIKKIWINRTNVPFKLRHPILTVIIVLWYSLLSACML